MYYSKCKTIVAVLACSVALGFGMLQISPELASAQDKTAKTGSPPPAGTPDIEPIDPTLVFEADVQKQLRSSPNQIRQLTEAHAKGTESVPDQNQARQ